MDEKGETQDDILMRSDTVSEIPGGRLVGGKPESDFPVTVQEFYGKHKSWLSLLLALLAFAVTFAVIALSGGESTFSVKKRAVVAAFEKVGFQNHVTIEGAEVEDHAAIVTAALLKVSSKFDPDIETKIYAKFNEFNKEYARTHKSPSDKRKKFLVYRENLHRINLHNGQEDKSFTMKMNHLGDMSAEEFMLRMNIEQPKNKQQQKLPVAEKNPVLDRPKPLVVADIDLRRQGVMTAVKDQGQCGSCWAFATVGVIESYFRKSGLRVPSLSEQQLVDCVSECNACKGGNPFYAYTYSQSKGLFGNFVYRYTASAGTCADALDSKKYKIPNFQVAEKDPDFVSILANHGPVTTCVSANDHWQFYHEGILDTCGTVPNHAVVLAGCGHKGSHHYWIIKNSWGVGWGNDGYCLLKRSLDPEYKNCGMDTFAIYIPKESAN